MAEPATKEMAMISVGGPITGGLIPNNFEGLWRMAQIMSASGLMPTGIQKPEAVFVAVQMGLEIGLSPMQAVQNVAVINGRPSLWGDSVLGLIRASGKLESFSEVFKGTFPEKTFAAVCVAKRKGDPEPIIREFSIDDARLANLWDKAGPWKQYPKRMLQMRARSWALRDGFGDVLKGLRIAEEEADVVEMVHTSSGYVVPQPEACAVDFDDIHADFAALVNRGIGQNNTDLVSDFVSRSAKTLGKTVAEIEEMATENWSAFAAQYNAWAKNTEQNRTEPDKTGQNATAPEVTEQPESTEKPEQPRVNWWTIEAHWKFRRKESMLSLVRCGYGLDQGGDDDIKNPGAFSALKDAPADVRMAVRAKFFGLYGKPAWVELMREAGFEIPDTKPPVTPDAAMEQSAIDALEEQMAKIDVGAVQKAIDEIGSPSTLEEYQAVVSRAIEWENGTAKPMREPGDEDERF